MSNIQLAITDPEYKQWISYMEKRFRQQQIKATVQVNSSKIEFYWSLGRDICEMHVEERWGECFQILPENFNDTFQASRSWRQR